MSDVQGRLARALVSLEGLSVGDAFGERFFVHPAAVQHLIGNRALPQAPWRYTDDTQMALSIVEVLARHGAMDQDALAKSFGRHYDITRGYGPAMHQLLPQIRSRKSWRQAAHTLFGGQGSYGNGAAMRVAPLGAYFADDLEAVAAQAALSAEVTHAHPEAAAGAIAVALAAALVWQARETPPKRYARDLLDAIAQRMPESEVRRGIERARDLPAQTSLTEAADTLGSGSRVSAQDTVPFALWCAAHYLESFEEALWTTVSGLGDRDTTCAIVGGIVACATGAEGIPAEWLASREPLPAWHLEGSGGQA